MFLWRNKKIRNPQGKYNEYPQHMLCYGYSLEVPHWCHKISFLFEKYHIQPNNSTVHLAFSKLLGKRSKIYIHLLKVKQDKQMTYLMVLTRCFVFFFFLIFFLKAYIVGTHLNCIDRSYAGTHSNCIDTIQMGTHNICLYKEVDKTYSGCNLKTTELLDCALIGVCALIRSNTVRKKIFVGLW